MPASFGLAKAVEPALVDDRLAPNADLLVEDELGESLSVDQVDGRCGCRRCLARRFGELAKGDEDRPFGSLCLRISLKQGHDLAADRSALRVIPLHLHSDARGQHRADWGGPDPVDAFIARSPHSRQLQPVQAQQVQHELLERGGGHPVQTCQQHILPPAWPVTLLDLLHRVVRALCALGGRIWL